MRNVFLFSKISILGQSFDFLPRGGAIYVSYLTENSKMTGICKLIFDILLLESRD